MKTYLLSFLILFPVFNSKIFGQCNTAFSDTALSTYTRQFRHVHVANEDSTTFFIWTFGDGDSAFTETPLHTYTDTGLFNVCLYVHIGSINCSSDTCLPVLIPVCEASFTYIYDPTFEQPEVNTYFFTNTSQGVDSTTHYQWVVGGGDLGSTKNLPWTFGVDDAGLQSVCLTIKNMNNSCFSTYCDTLNISPLCAGDSFMYSHQGSLYTFSTWTCGYFKNYIWDFGDGITDTVQTDNVVHNYLSAANSYNVCLTVNYDSLCQWYLPCTAIFCHTVNTNNTGINATGMMTEPLAVYPNPAGKTIKVSTTRTAPASLQLRDFTGRIVKHFPLPGNQTELDISELSSGIYLLEFNDAIGARTTFKLVKE